jgi:hypothetical protein
MRRFILIVPLAASLIGCSTEPKIVAPGIGLFDHDRVEVGPLVQGHTNTQPDIPFPETTDFDDDREARASYMSAFEDGYRARLRGEHGVICTFGLDGRRGFAREIGYMHGQGAALKVVMEIDMKRIEDQRRRLKERSNIVP